jgi:RNA polymerase sigma-70 factor (ECF subfamily)
VDVGGRLAASSDRELIDLVANESQDALAELYRRHGPWLLARLRHRCADDGLVAEALQDTFVGVWRGASQYQGSGELAGWLWGIGIRRLVGLLRELGALPGALARLSPELRAVVQATVLDGLTTREAARLLGIPAGTVKTRMMRARTELRGALT